MKYTLLQMTQDILSGMSSDEVNSISDTVESLQVATILKQKYFDILSRIEITDHEQLCQLQPSLDPTIPVLMYVPTGISQINWIKYFDTNVLDGNTATDFAHDLNTDITPNSGSGAPKWSTTSTTSNSIGNGTKTFTVSAGLTIKTGDNAIATVTNNTNTNMSGLVVSYSGTTLTLNITSTNGNGTYTAWSIQQGSAGNFGPGYLYVTILPNDEFLDMVHAYNLSDHAVQQFTLNDNSNKFNGAFTFYYKNDQQPTYCTILSNYYVIFNAYDNSQDSTLTSAKTMALGYVIPTWQMVDTFIPDLAEEQFPLLINEAKELAFYELKQQAHPLADREVKRGWVSIQKKKAIINRPTFFDELPGFGRRRGYYGYRGSWYGYPQNSRGGISGDGYLY